MLSISMADIVISYKRSKETLKKSKSLVPLYKLGSRPQKSPKIAKKKNRSLNRDLLTPFIVMVCFGWYLLNPHLQAVQNVCDKGGKKVF